MTETWNVAFKSQYQYFSDEAQRSK